MTKVIVFASFLVFILSSIHSLVRGGSIQYHILLYLPLGLVLIGLVSFGFISERHFENLPALIDGIFSIFK